MSDNTTSNSFSRAKRNASKPLVAAQTDAPPISRDVPGYDADTWFALFAPGGMSRELVARIYEDVAAVLKIEEVRKRLLDIGGNPGGEPPEAFAARVRADIDKWKKVAQQAGIKPQ